MAQLSHPYMTTGETIALTIQTFVSKETSQIFNMLSRFVIAFLLRSRHLLISWLQLPSTVILEPKKTKSVTISTFSSSIFHEMMRLMPWSLFFECWALSQLLHASLSPSSGGSLVPLSSVTTLQYPSEWGSFFPHVWVIRARPLFGLPEPCRGRALLQRVTENKVYLVQLKYLFRTYLVVQWLRLRAPNAKGQGSIPGQGTRSYVPEL